MAKGFFDDQTIDVPCPVAQCRSKATARIGELKAQATLRCGAGHDFDVDAKKLLRGLKDAEKTISNFGKGLKF
jgi:hypothetical protein